MTWQWSLDVTDTMAHTYHKPAGCTPWKWCRLCWRLYRCRRLYLSSQRWRSVAGDLLTKPWAAGLTWALILDMVFKRVTYTALSAPYNVHIAYFFCSCCHFVYLFQTHTHLPSFLQVRLGGGMPLDSHTRVMRLPSITVRGDTSSEPRILGETVIMKGHQKEAFTSHSSDTLEHFTEVKSEFGKTEQSKNTAATSVCENVTGK